jgi:serine protease Do
MVGPRTILYGLVTSTLLLTAEAHAAPLPNLYDRAGQASVELLVDGHLDGSGVIISSDGLVLTAAHLIGPDHALEVRSPTIGRRTVHLLAADPAHDLALLQLPTRRRPYPRLGLARVIPPPGADVYLFASPLYRHAVMLRGTLARTRPTYEYHPDRGHYLRVLHLSGPSPAGTSGGPWLDEKGRVIGVQAGLVHDGEAPVGIAYMAPLGAIKRLVRRRRPAPVATLRAGFEELWEQAPALRALFPPAAEGVLPVRIFPGGPADHAGLRQTDLITAVGGHHIRLRDELLDHLRIHPPNRPLELTIYRPDVGRLAVKTIPRELTRSLTAPTRVVAYKSGKTLP